MRYNGFLKNPSPELNQGTGPHSFSPLPSPQLHTDSLHAALVGPERKKKHRARAASGTAPVNVAYTVETRRAKGKRTAIEQQRSTLCIVAPQAATIGAAVAPLQQFAMLIHITHQQNTVLIYDKFLIHSQTILMTQYPAAVSATPPATLARR
jgi:hypothetical protein